MAKKPRLHICFPVFNTGELFRGFLQAADDARPLLEALGVNVELIAIDDASTDKVTLDILRNPPVDLEVIRLERNLGCCGGLARALRTIRDRGKTGDYMSWLDSDGEHAPRNLVHMLTNILSGEADLSLLQLIWRESHMEQYDRQLQKAMGTLEARVILGPNHQWDQHCPGCWVVRGEFVERCERTFSDYLAYYERTYNEFPRWGEDMTFVACVHRAGGRIDYSSLQYSHMAAPNRPEEKVVSQYQHALAHLKLYPRFFAAKDS